MPPVLTAKCLHEPFSKPGMIKPCYTHDSSGQALTLQTSRGYSSCYRVDNIALSHPWVSGYTQSPMKEAPSKQWPSGRRLCVCVCVCIGWGGVDMIKKWKDSFQKSIKKMTEFGWNFVRAFTITVLTLNRPPSWTIGKTNSHLFLGCRLPDPANQLTAGTKCGAYSIFTGGKDQMHTSENRSRIYVVSQI